MEKAGTGVSRSELSLRRAALVGGLSLLLMTLCAIYADIYMRGTLLVADDPALTIANIQKGQLLFRTGIIGYLIAAILDIVVACSLYVFLKRAEPHLALLAAWFRVLYAGIFTVAISSLLSVQTLLAGSGYNPSTARDHLQSQVMCAIASFSNIWSIGLVLFGIHLAVLGAAGLRSGYMPRYLGVVLLIAGVGYILDFGMKLLYPSLSFQLATVVGWGELLLMIWLLTKGRKFTIEQTA